MASQTRGSIEEGSVTFTNETEKTVEFVVAGIQGKSFPSAPVVKLISVSNYPPTLMYNKKYLLYDAEGSFVPVYPTDGSPATVTETTTNTSVADEYSTTLNASANIVGKALKLEGATDFAAVSFDNLSITDSSLIQVFFQAKFIEWDDDSGDEAYVYFVNESEIDLGAAGDWDSSDVTQTIDAKYTLFVNNAGTWTPIPNRANITSYTVALEATELNDVIPTFSTGLAYHWFRIDITKAASAAYGRTIDITKLKGISFLCSASSGGAEFISIADVSVVIWDSNTTSWTAGHNLLTNQVSDVTQSNIGVTFTNVTATGMTVITSAPFIGTMRYLCSVQG